MRTTLLRFLIINFLMSAFLTVVSQEIDYKGFPQWSWHKQDSTEYMLYTPTDMKKGEKYPVALFLHGCCGQDYRATLRNAVDPPVRMWHSYGANTQRIPTYIVAPKTSEGWSQHIENLKKVIDKLIISGQADPQRIYITGFSMGGAGTWEFLNRYPDYFAAALPMGMDFQGDPERVKHIPVWTNKGETDWFARSLNKQVAVLRALNGNPYDLDATWQTGVNPLFTEFKGVGHGVQWIATSTQDLVEWAYSKVNDGNRYPNVYFETPAYRQKFKEGQEVQVKIKAYDPDGSIERIEILLNDQPYATLTNEPYRTTFKISKGDLKIDAKAFDNKGKVSVATSWVKADQKTELITTTLPYGIRGALYEKQFFARGNGEIKFELMEPDKMPEGMTFSSKGILGGIPVKVGSYSFLVRAFDEDKGDEQTKRYTLEVREKGRNEAIVTNVRNYRGDKFPLAKVRAGESLWRNSDGEINFSDVSNYGGLTFIQGDSYDTTNVREYISFQVDEPAIIYVAYERKNVVLRSTTPEWLEDFNKESHPQIVAQYFYYDVYSKHFPKGLVVLEDAYEKANGVNTNYFIMVGTAASRADKSKIPLINFDILPDAKQNEPYKEKFTCLNNIGPVTWQIVSGELPDGMKLHSDGLIGGVTKKAGQFAITIAVQDTTTKTEQRKKVVLTVK